MCISLLARQRGRYNHICDALEIHPIHDSGHEGLYYLTFLGTVINGVTVCQMAYVVPRSAGYKTCSFGCGADKLSNPQTTRTHHKPKREDWGSTKCTNLPRSYQGCSSREQFCRVRDLGAEGGIRVYFHEYKYGVGHFKTQLLQVGQALLEFASKDLGMGGDSSVMAWNSAEAGQFLNGDSSLRQ